MSLLRAPLKSLPLRILFCASLLAGTWALAGKARLTQGPWAGGQCEVTLTGEDGQALADWAYWSWTVEEGGGSLRQDGPRAWYRPPQAHIPATAHIRVQDLRNPTESTDLHIALERPAVSASAPPASAPERDETTLYGGSSVAFLSPATGGFEPFRVLDHFGTERLGMRLSGKWLAGGPAGLSLVSLVHGRLQIEPLPGAPRNVRALAVRPAGAARGGLAAVFACETQPESGKGRCTLYGMDDEGRVLAMVQAQPGIPAQGGPGNSNLPYEHVTGLAMCRDGSLLVAESGSRKRIRRIYPDGHVVHVGSKALLSAEALPGAPLAMALEPVNGRVYYSLGLGLRVLSPVDDEDLSLTRTPSDGLGGLRLQGRCLYTLEPDGNLGLFNLTGVYLGLLATLAAPAMDLSMRPDGVCLVTSGLGLHCFDLATVVTPEERLAAEAHPEPALEPAATASSSPTAQDLWRALLRSTAGAYRPQEVRDLILSFKTLEPLNAAYAGEGAAHPDETPITRLLAQGDVENAKLLMTRIVALQGDPATALPPGASVQASASSSSAAAPSGLRLELVAALPDPKRRPGAAPGMTAITILEADPTHRKLNPFRDISAIAYVEPDPACDQGILAGKWLVGTQRGLYLLSREAGQIKVSFLRGSPKHLTALAVRPPGSLPGNPWVAVLASTDADRNVSFHGLDRNLSVTPVPQGPHAPAVHGCTGLVLNPDGSFVFSGLENRLILKWVPGRGNVFALAQLPPTDQQRVAILEGQPVIPTRGIAVDPVTHVLYIVDGHAIRSLSPDGAVTTLLGSVLEPGLLSSPVAPVPPGKACLRSPRALALHDGRLYILDLHAIRIFDLKTRTLVMAPGSGSIQSPDFFDAISINAEGQGLATTTEGQLLQLDLPAREAGLAPSAPAGPFEALPDDLPPQQSPTPMAMAADRPSLWPLLLLPRSAYDPEAITQFLAADPSHRAAAILTEPYPGPETRLQGAMPLMQLLWFRDQGNALLLLNQLKGAPSEAFNAPFTQAPLQGVNPFLYALMMDCPMVAQFLSAMPQVDLSSKGSYSVAPGSAAHNHPPAYALCLTGYFLSPMQERILKQNAANPDYFRFKFRFNGQDDLSIAKLMTHEKIKFLYKNTPAFKEAYKTIAELMRANPKPARKALKPQAEAPSALPAPERATRRETRAGTELPASAAPDPDLLRTGLATRISHTLDGLGTLRQTFGKWEELRDQELEYQRLRPQAKAIVQDPPERKKRSLEKVQTCLTALDKLQPFLEASHAQLKELEARRDLLRPRSIEETPEQLAEIQAQAVSLLDAFKRMDRELDTQRKGSEERFLFVTKSVAVALKEKPAPAPPIPVALPEPEALPVPTPAVPAAVGPRTPPPPAPSQPPVASAPASSSSSSSSSGYRHKPAPSAKPVLKDVLELGNASALPELLVLAHLLAIPSYQEAELQRMETLALLGSCARIMDQAQAQATNRSGLLDAELAKVFRNVLFHDPRLAFELAEVKAFAASLLHYCQTYDGMPLTPEARATIDGPFLKRVLGRAVPSLPLAEWTLRIQETDSQYQALKARPAADPDEALFKARAMGFLEAKLGAFCADWYKGRALEASRARAPLPAATMALMISQGKKFRHKDYAPLSEVVVQAPAAGTPPKARLPFAPGAPGKPGTPPARALGASEGGPELGRLISDYPELTAVLEEAAVDALMALPPNLQLEVCQSAQAWVYRQERFHHPPPTAHDLSEVVISQCHRRAKEAAPWQRRHPAPRTTPSPLSPDAPAASSLPAPAAIPSASGRL